MKGKASGIERNLVRSERAMLGWAAGGLLALALALAGCRLLPGGETAAPAPSPTVTAIAPTVSATPAPGVTAAATIIPPTSAPTVTPPAPLSYLAQPEGGPTELHLFDAAGDQLLATDRQGFASLAWSPNGRLGAAVVTSAGDKALIVIDVSARQARRTITAGPGARLAFRPAANWSRLLAQREDELWLIETAGGEPRRLTQTAGSLASWDISGDGRWALLGVEAEGHYVTSLLQTQGNQAIEISGAPHPAAEFSADGRWLALLSDGGGSALLTLRLIDLNALPADAATRIIATANSIAPAITRDGASRYFTADGSWLGLLAGAGDKLSLRLRELAGPARAEFPWPAAEQLSWMVVYPTLRRALLVSGNATASARQFRLQLLYLDQQTSVPLIDGLGEAFLLSEPDNPLAATDAVAPAGEHFLALTDVAQGASRIVLRGALRPLAVSADGSRAIVALGPAGQEQVHLLDLKTGGTVLFLGLSAGGEARAARAGFAPAGPAVWAWLWQPDGAAQLVVSPDGRSAPATVGEHVSEMAFAPGGNALAFVGEMAQGAGLYLAWPDGRGLRFLAKGRAPRWLAP